MTRQARVAVRVAVVLLVVLLTTSLAAQVTITLTPGQQDVLRTVLVALVPAPAPPATGPSVTVPAGGDIQQALDTVPDGGTVYLAQGATYTTNIVFKKRSGSVTLRTAGLDDTVMPPGVRVGPGVTPATVAKMAKITCRDCLAATIGAAFGAHDISVIGLEVIASSVVTDRNVISLGTDANWEPARTLADLPLNVTFDRIYVHADNGGHLGIRLDGRNANVLESDIRGFLAQGRDSQAIAIINGSGPFLIRNNYLEASGENFMTGGADPTIPNLIPSDITFIGNYVFKPLVWKSKPGSVKNLFELKNARRILVDGNVFENNWIDGQAGSAIVITVRNQDGGCPWCTVEDVTFTNNVVKNGGTNAFNILGTDDAHVSAIAKTLRVTNNLLLGVTRGAQIAVPVTGLEFGHNTFIGVDYYFLTVDGARLPLVKGSGLNVHDNISAGGPYGLHGPTGDGTAALTAFFSGWAFRNNVVEGNVERVIAYPATTTTLAPGTLAAAFDPRFRYLGPEAGSDGRKPGADVDAILKAIPWLTWP